MNQVHYAVNQKKSQWVLLSDPNVLLKDGWNYASVRTVHVAEGVERIKKEFVPKEYEQVDEAEAIDLTRVRTVEV